MDKQAFLACLREGLSGLPEDDVAERLQFYSEMIDDRLEEGATEEEAVAGLGPVDEIVAQIVSEIPLTKLVRERVKPKRRIQAWEIVLLVLGSPIWISLLIAVFAVVLSVYVVIWAAIVCVWAVELSLIVASFGCMAGGIILLCKGIVLPGVAALCAGAVLAGLSILLFFGCLGAGSGAIWLTKKIALAIKALFVRKENAR